MTTWLVTATVVMLWVTYSCLGWMDFLDWRTGAPRRPGVAIARLVSVSKFRSGSKGYVVWRTGQALPAAIWIPGRHPLLGSHLMVRAEPGWGPHHPEPVAFVKQVHRVMLPGSLLMFRLICLVARGLVKLSSSGRRDRL